MQGKHFVLGITGGIAAYKVCELVRLMVKGGATVQVVMTEAATHFVGRTTFQALSGRPVHVSQWDDDGASVDNGMAHIELTRHGSQEADAVIVAPATANFMAKLAYGLADDLLSTLCIARRPSIPLFIAPAMNVEMWQAPATQRNLAQLRADGVRLLGPGSGSQACGETGDGRMLEAAEIAYELEAALQPKLLAGKRVLLTAGPTEEAIDPVRVITNSSSGKMGFALAQAAYEAGATVTVVAGPTSLATPRGVTRVDVKSARDMHAAVHQAVAGHDIFIAVAAVADYHVKNPAAQKIKKSGVGSDLTIELAENPDILASVAALPNPPYCVGFAAESEKLLQHGQEKRQRKKVPLLAVNLAQAAFGAHDNELLLLDDAGTHTLARAPKLTLARQLVAHIAAGVAKR
jgi:phosphopantothenoylcysteine decarboxylase / phosphopantothenate---cysteine ligase